MYLRYFALQDHPFAITPDPAFLYLSAHHREALGHLLYGTGEYGGFVQLTGEVGTGKTTLIRALLEQQHEVDEVDVALCLNPQLTVLELLAAICDELDVDYDDARELSLKYLVDRLNAHLLQTHAAGRRTVLIIDEAQNLSREVLEQVRLLTNLETGKHKLLRIILVGQPELEEMLARPDLRQLSQRITARFHLPGLNREQTQSYIGHRLRVAGGEPGIFTKAACAAVYKASGGTPRLINTICERALMGAYARERKPVTPAVVRQAARETMPRSGSAGGEGIWQQILPVFVLLGAALLAFGLHHFLLMPSIDERVAPATVADAPEQTDTDPLADQPTAEPSKEQEAQPVVYELPAGDASMGQLLRLWGVFGAEVNQPCRSLKLGDLRCLQGEISLETLRRFNHPAILILREGDTRRQVLLSNLNDDTVTLVSAEGTREWPRQELLRRWTGEVQMLWRLQTSTRQIGEGSVGDSVVWLRRRLALAQGVNLDAKAGQPSPIFDNELLTELRAFQRAQGLEVDGLVGARTMVALNSLKPAPGTPLLSNAPSTSPLQSGDAPAQACTLIASLPAAEERLRIGFAANATRLSGADENQVLLLAEALADVNEPIYVTGTSYNPNMPADELRNLALQRSQAVAAGLVRNGLDAEQLHCVALSGPTPPTANMDRVAVVYVGLQAAP